MGNQTQNNKDQNRRPDTGQNQQEKGTVEMTVIKTEIEYTPTNKEKNQCNRKLSL